VYIGSGDDHEPTPPTIAVHTREERNRKMSVTPIDYVFAPDLVAAAREFVRSVGDGEDYEDEDR
jgi:hypothetical protein